MEINQAYMVYLIRYQKLASLSRLMLLIFKRSSSNCVTAEYVSSID